MRDNSRGALCAEPKTRSRMFLAARLLDVVLVVLLIVYLIVGWRGGFARTLSALLGVIVGAIAAFLAIPLIIPLIPASGWRLAATLGIAVVLVVGGQIAGRAIGSAIRGAVRPTPLRVLDRIFGAVIGVVGAALAASLVLGSLTSLGAPFLSQATAGSTVLQTIDRLTPTIVQSGLARIRSAVLDNGLPRIGEALGGITDSPGVPQVDTGTSSLSAAARSVVRINGAAIACGQNQSGSGFVVAPNRILTNAHVVAGVTAPVVEAPNGQAVEGRIVYFDPIDDLAMIATSGLDVAALELSPGLEVGDDAAVDGYPYGGPFVTGAAEVLAESTELVDDIYDSSGSPRAVYTLAAVVEPGNSGGPLITTTGQVAGVVFAESSTDPQLGYAMTQDEFAPVVAQATSLDRAIEPGRCVQG